MSNILNPLDEKDAADIPFYGIGKIFERFRIDLENNIGSPTPAPMGMDGKVPDSLTICVTEEQRRSAKLSDLLFAAMVVSSTMHRALGPDPSPENHSMLQLIRSDNEHTAALEPFVVRPFIVAKTMREACMSTMIHCGLRAADLLKSTLPSGARFTQRTSAFEVRVSRSTLACLSEAPSICS